MAENNTKFKKPVLPGQNAQIAISPELEESLQKIGDTVARAFGRDGKKILKTDREGNLDLGATVRAFTNAFNKTSGVFVNETANALGAGTSFAADIGGVKFQADIPPQIAGQMIDGQRKSADALGQVIGDIGNAITAALAPKTHDPDAGGLPAVPAPGPKQDSMRFVNMMVNSAVGSFIFVEEVQGRNGGMAGEGGHLLSSGDLLDYGINPREKSLEVGAQYAQGDPALTYLALSKLQESGIFKGQDKEYADQAMQFLKAHNDLSDLGSERMKSAQEFFAKVPEALAGVSKEIESPAMADPEFQADRRQSYDTLKR
jgi:hypothetical protein